MCFVAGFGFVNLAWSIRDLQRRLKLLSETPRPTVKYVYVFEKYAEKVDGNELTNTVSESIHKGPKIKGPTI